MVKHRSNPVQKFADEVDAKAVRNIYPTDKTVLKAFNDT